MPHAAKGRPVDYIATVVVRFPTVICSPMQPLPILRIVVFVVIIVFVVVAVIVKQALPPVCAQFLVALDGMAEMGRV